MVIIIVPPTKLHFGVEYIVSFDSEDFYEKLRCCVFLMHFSTDKVYLCSNMIFGLGLDFLKIFIIFFYFLIYVMSMSIHCTLSMAIAI